MGFQSQVNSAIGELATISGITKGVKELQKGNQAKQELQDKLDAILQSKQGQTAVKEAYERGETGLTKLNIHPGLGGTNKTINVPNKFVGDKLEPGEQRTRANVSEQLVPKKLNYPGYEEDTK